MEMSEFRSKSRTLLSKSNLRVPGALPLIEDFSPRRVTEVLDRIVCLNAVAAVAHGFDRYKASAWLSQEGVLERTTAGERSFLDKGVGNIDGFQVQVEGMWALTWLIGIVAKLDFWRSCDPHFVTMLPDIKTGEASSNFRGLAQVRSKTEIGLELDLAYCLHWILRDAETKGESPPDGNKSYVVVERRRSLEWAVGDANWDEVSLDT